MTLTNRPRDGLQVPAPSPLAQSRELGDVLPEKDGAAPRQQKSPFAKSWPHMVAGGVGGMTAAVFTAPLDVLKTRLQSDFYQAQLRAAREAATATAGGGHVRMTALRSMRYHLAETLQILRDHQLLRLRHGKRAYSAWTGTDATNPWVHLAAAATAGIATSTATNPIWLVKTRLQLDKNDAARKGDVNRRAYRNSWDCIRRVMRNEGPKGFFKGMSASYLGVTESTLHWVLYENFKERLRNREARIVESGRDKTWWDNTVSWTGNFMSAAPMADGRPKYTGLVHCFKLVFKEEGFLGLYGGLTPHLMRTIPSAAVMFGMYEAILKLFGSKS
ncbi:mitochondrial carrier [Apiospora phragmitis]|uniref:Mitochondrial carrier n=1 Tax=Apiospora phragmitis TaxID=2905665 RepID=A0ABR1VVJ2_9PEZI